MEDSQNGLKVTVLVHKADLSWFLANFGNSAKFTCLELAFEILYSFRVVIQVYSKTSGMRNGVLNIKIWQLKVTKIPL